MIKICIAGATGWVGRDLMRAVTGTADLRLVGAVARRAFGRDRRYPITNGFRPPR